MQILLAVVVAALVFFVYSPSVQGPFLFDDVGRIEQNTQLRVTSLDPSGLMAAGFEGAAATRPVAMISFALNYYAHGLTTTGFHVVNVVIHVLAGFLFYYFVTLTLGLRPLREYASHAREIAFFAALLWLLHPLATQAVAYIVQRMTALSGLFYLLSLISYVRGRLGAGAGVRRAWFAACGVAAVLALGSKETAITLPAVILLYEWYFFKDLDRGWLWKMSPVLAGGALAGLVALLWLAPLSGYAAYDFTLGERLMTEARVVVYYLSLIALPHPSRLSADYAFPVSTSLITPVTTLLSIAAIAGLLVLAWTTAKAHRLVSFGILWYLGNLVLESTVIPLDLVFEHRNYVPSMGVWLIAVALACRYVNQPWVRRGAFTAVAVVLSIWTYQRSSVWSDALLLWSDTALKQPGLARAHYNLGLTRELRKDYRGAVDDYARAVVIKPEYFEAFHGLGNAKNALGDYRGAITAYEVAIKLNPGYTSAYVGRGNARQALGDRQAALADQDKAVGQNPRSGDALSNRAVTRQSLGDYQGAIADYTTLIALEPNHKTAYINRGAAKNALKDHAGAIADLMKAIEIDPRSADAYVNLGNARRSAGDVTGALADFSKALQINPRSEAAYLNRAVARHASKDYKGAIADYTVLFGLNPKFSTAVFNRGHAKLAIQDTKGACEDFRQAVALGHPGADLDLKKYCG